MTTQPSPPEVASTAWYRAGEEDNFDISTKILRTGCRDVYRSLVECRNRRDTTAEECQRAESNHNECMKIYKFLLSKKT